MSGIGPSSENLDAVTIREVSFAYGSLPLLRDVSLRLAPGQFLTLLGPSGCGKTTLLKLVGGYLTPGKGAVFLRGRDVTRLPPEDRRVGMVFQNYALFPHLSARRNVSFPLEVRGIAGKECARRVEVMLDLVGLTPAERDRKPAQLSGGQQQRVALARALIFSPDLLLLDEPLANLDRRLRDQLQMELRRLQRETGVAAILVTHDQEEAMAVSDRVGVMSRGRILQVGSPEEVYRRPQTPFIARALGDANLLPGSLLGQDHAIIMVRPEQCVLGTQAQTCRWHLEGRLTSVVFRGADGVAEIACESGFSLRVCVRDLQGLHPGQVICVGIPASAAWPIPEHDPCEDGSPVEG